MRTNQSILGLRVNKKVGDQCLQHNGSMASSNGTLVKRLLMSNNAINVFLASISIILSTNVKESFKEYAENCLKTG